MRFLVLILGGFLSLSALSDERGPCFEDGPRLCKGVPFRQGKMFRCLLSQKKELSETCRRHVTGLDDHRRICSKEISKHCQKKPFYCLLLASHSNLKFEGACQNDINAKATYRKFCKTEISSHCSKLTSNGAIVDCLKTKSPQLSKRCSEDLTK